MAESLILFGAGASFGSGDVVPKPPPMARDLLIVLVRLFPQTWGKLPEGVMTELSNDFESGMVTIEEHHAHALAPLQRNMASFFFNFQPGPNNLYRQLAQRILKSNWQGCLVTLNYERLLELSMSEEGLSPFCGSPSTGSSHPVELCLPHGCSHIFCESVRGSAAGISFSAGVTTSGAVNVIGNYAEFTKRIQEDAFPPVMSYFNPSKSTTSGTNFIEEQRAHYEGLVIEADTIAIVGVRVRPHDGHLWDALAATSAELVYCSGISAAREFEEWANRVRNGRPNTVLEKYFSDGFDEICTAVGLG